MKIFFRIILLFLIPLNLFASESNIDSITLTKITKLIQKEEAVALAYKEYILKEGTNPTSISALIEGDYLPKGFNTINPFGKEIKFDNTTPYKLESSIPDNIDLKTNLFDYYYSNKYRVYTKSPLSVNNNKIEIILSTKEKFIYDNTTKITTVKADAKNKYYLDDKGVLHWYDSTETYKFSFDKDLLLDSSVTMLDLNGDMTDEFKTLMDGKNVMYSGQTILYKKDGVALEYLNLGTNLGIVKVNSVNRDVGKTIIQFSRRAGGMIVNGDIYTWGNNANKITGINLGYSGSTGSNRYPVITGLVRAKAKMYDDDSTDTNDFTKYYDQNYFSSPNRPKFIDFFSAVFFGTCGVSTKGELYCGGTTGLDYSFGNNFTAVDTSRNGEMLYRSTFFDGKTNKAKKVFANNQIWHILNEDGLIYTWGYDFGSAFSGTSSLTYNYNCNGCPNSNLSPQSISSIKFSDITYLLTIGHRKIAGLSTTGDIYIWGREYYKDNSSSSYETYNCSNTWESTSFDLCTPTKVEISNSTMTSSINFESIQGGLDAFIAKGEDGKYYKISHPKTKKIQVLSITDAIKSYSGYDPINDAEILSVDFSRKIDEQGLTNRYKPSSGIVWINSKYQLQGDYFTSSNEKDTIFKEAIKQIKWKKIKVIDADNGICGIDINNQMYCWGIQSFYRDGDSSIDYMGNTFMIPVFNTNLYDSDKDFLVAEGGYNGYLTNMTSDTWETTNSAGKTGAFFMKYPTYIGGFNYEFIFK